MCVCVCVLYIWFTVCVFFCSDQQETLDPISGIAASEQLLIAVSYYYYYLFLFLFF